MRPPLGAPVGLLWDPQVTHGKPKGYAFERQGNPKEGTPGQKSKVEEGAGFWQTFFHDVFPRMEPAAPARGREGERGGRLRRSCQLPVVSASQVVEIRVG
jgi:hypothetical protein